MCRLKDCPIVVDKGQPVHATTSGHRVLLKFERFLYGNFFEMHRDFLHPQAQKVSVQKLFELLHLAVTVEK